MADMAPQLGAETGWTHKWSLRKHWVLFRKCRKLLTLKSVSTPLPCYFANVPVEVLILILSRAVSGSNKTLFAVCGVCRQWREILFDVPHVWKNLDLTVDSYWTSDKVDAWLRRANGSLSRLYLGGQCKVLTEDSLYKRIPWSTLRELYIVNWEFSEKKYFLQEIAGQLQLRSFACRVRRLNLELPLDNVASSSLTNLELSGSFSTSRLLVLLDRNPMIVRIVLRGGDEWPADLQDPVIGAGSIELAHLTHLELSNCSRENIILRAIRFPNIRTLSLIDLRRSCKGMMAIHQAPHLEVLEYENTAYDHRDLISFLRHAPALEILSIRSYEFRGYEWNVDKVIQALAEVIPQGSVTTPDAVGTLCCPRLQKVDIRKLHNLSASSLLKLVRSRLNGIGNSQISLLYLDDLYSYEGTRFPLSEQDVEWLRANVPDFLYAGFMKSVDGEDYISGRQWGKYEGVEIYW